MKEARRLLGMIPTALLAICTATTFEPVRAQEVPDPEIERVAVIRLPLSLDIGDFHGRWGSQSTAQAVELHRIYVVDISSVPGGPTPEEFADMVAGDTLFAEPDYFADAPEGSGRNFFCTIVRDSSAYHNQSAWGQINLATAHQISTGAGTTVAIIDTGVDRFHPELSGRVLTTGWNFQDNNDDVSDVGDGEQVGHGTHMAGIIAKIAPDASILPIKVLDSDGKTDTFMLAQGIYYAINSRVDVINLSIGSTYDARPVEEALRAARAVGIVVVAAAGNVAMHDPSWEFPALNDEVIGVVAVDDEEEKPDFSNYNELFALSAPGVGIFSTIPDERYADLDGTSTATPMVAGAAALLISAHPEWLLNETRPIQVEAYLRQSALNVDGANPGFEGFLGSGRLDIGGALDRSIVFDEPEAISAGVEPTGVTAADLNGDFVDDLAVLDRSNDSVAVLHNNGDGTFVFIAAYGVGAAPADLAVARLNNDAHRDLAVADEASDSVSILLNNGDGTFAAASSYPAGISPATIVAADFDDDGDVDLAVANDDSPGLVIVLINDGQGGFSIGGSLAVGDRPRDLIALDLSGDLLPDLAVVNRDSDDVSVLINLGGGAFAPAVSYAVDPVGQEPRFLIGADLDGDDAVDLVTSNKESDNLTLLRNNGDGTFAMAVEIAAFVELSPDALSVGDFDCDGDIDLGVLNGDKVGSIASILLNEGDASFPSRHNKLVGPESRSIVVGDLDDDGDADLVLTDSSGGNLMLLINQSCAARRRGDLNCDGFVNALDIEPFITALFDPSGYESSYPDCDITTGDVNRDGSVDTLDVEPFVTILFEG